MKHKHYDMIVAKAANMELVVFIKHNNEDVWKNMHLVGFQFPDLGGTHDYFMCLQKHSKQALAWLNGGDVQGEDLNNTGSFDDYAPHKDRIHWSSTAWYMRDDRNIRIKPNKEKRWIGFNPKTLKSTHETYSSGIECEDALNDIGEIYENHPWQFIEIEVEV